MNDVAGYSRLMGGDGRATVDTLSGYRQLIRERVERQEGRVVDARGDAILAESLGAFEALDWATDARLVPAMSAPVDRANLR